MIYPEVLSNPVSANHGAVSRGCNQPVQGATMRLEWDLNPGLTLKPLLRPLLPYASGRDNQNTKERLRQGLEKGKKGRDWKWNGGAWKAWTVLLKEEVSYWLTLPFRGAAVPFPLCPPHSHPRPPHLRSLSLYTTSRSCAERNSLLQEDAKAMKMNYKHESSFASSNAEIFFFF